MPRGERVALCQLEDEPGKLAEDHGLVFAEGTEDRGPYVWAAIEIDGEVFVLVRSAGSLEPGTTVYGAGSSELVPRVLNIARTWINSDA